MKFNLQILGNDLRYISSGKYSILLVFILMVSGLKAQTVVQVGDAIENNMTEGFTVPLYRTGNPSTGQYLYSRHFFIYSQADLCKAKLNPGATISKLAWFKGGVGSVDGVTHSFKIYLKNSNIISRTGGVWSELINGATKVYDNEAMVVPSTGGWWELDFTTPFIYTGGGIEVYTDWYVGGGANGSRTGGRIQFGMTTRSGGIDAITLSGGSGKFSPFTDAETIGGGVFTTNVSSNLLNVRFTQEGGTTRAEICSNGIDDNCDGQIDEGCPMNYASKQTGFWNNANNWYRFLFGPVNAWVNALKVPELPDLTLQIANTHTITVNTFVEADQLTINAGGKLRITTPGQLSLNNGSGDDLVNKGTLELTISANLGGAGNFVNEGTTTITNAILEPAATLNKGTLTFSGDNFCQVLNNNGTVNWQTGKHTTPGNGTFTNNATGIFVISSDNTFGTGDLVNNGTFRKTSSGTTTFTSTVINTGKIEGVGTIRFTGGINNTGSIYPGLSGVGKLTLNSSGINPLTNTSTLNIEIQNGNGAGLGNDLLERDGDLVLQGNLIVTELANVPAGTYEIIRLNSGTLSGSFQQTQLPPGYTFQVSSNSVVLTKPNNIVLFPGSGNNVRFDGDNDIARVLHNNNFNFAIGQDFTVDFWVRVPTDQQTDISTTTNVLLEKWGSPWSAHPFSISVTNHTHATPGKILFTRHNGTKYYGFYSATTINDGRFHHIAVQKQGTSLRIFIDGISGAAVLDETTGETANINDLHIGSSSDGSGSFRGDIDELRIWNTALNTDLIRTWMCKKIISTHPSYSNLVSYFPMDHGAGSSGFLDNKGANNGSIYNGALFALSAAPVGSASAYSYGSSPSATLSLQNGEKLTATSAVGVLTGIHVYAVETAPNTSGGITGVGANDRYFGVYTIGSATPEYTGIYDYSGNPFVVSEDGLQLYKRNANDVSTWTIVNATQNTAANTFTFTGNFTEYMLGNLGGTLPLHLLSFSASKKSNDAVLQWRTSNEVNVTRFEILRSLDGRDFTTIGNLPAGGNLYSFTDPNIFIGSNLAFYRLKSIDNDGRFTYSNIIKLTGQQVNKLNVFPNPVTDIVTISGLQLNGKIRLTSAEGKLMYQQTVTQQTISINIAKYAAGTYLLQYQNNEQVVNQKIIKQ